MSLVNEKHAPSPVCFTRKKNFANRPVFERAGIWHDGRSIATGTPAKHQKTPSDIFGKDHDDDENKRKRNGRGDETSPTILVATKHLH
jgi:hypothetical protein